MIAGIESRKAALLPGRMREAGCVKGSECKIPAEPGIYRFVDRYTGEIDYIGQTENLRKRLQQHVNDGNLDLNVQKIQYGVARPDATRDDLCDAEQAHIHRHAPKKNKCKGGNGRRIPGNEVITSYLKQIAQTPLLMAGEEVNLSLKISELSLLERSKENLIQQLGREPQYEEWAGNVGKSVIDLRTCLYEGRRARERIVNAHLRLVLWTAQKYVNRGMSLNDLIQEGCLGLIRAAERFNYEKGFNFASYARFYIKQAIAQAVVNQSRTICLPNQIQESFVTIQMTAKVLLKELKRRPTEKELAERLEMSLEQLRSTIRVAQLPLSLESCVSKEKSTPLVDCIESDIATPEEQVSRSLLREDLEAVLQTLSSRERNVVKLRFGIDDGRMKSLEEIGKILSVSRERIRQIEAKAVHKLRHPNRNFKLREYL